MKSSTFSRRNFIRHASVLPLFLPLSGYFAKRFSTSSSHLPNVRKAKIKLSCNFYSFNRPLRDGAMTLEEVIDFCADLGFDAIDPTGYYLQGYPNVPSDEYLYRIKKRAFQQGLAISGTGVRNDFTIADEAKRIADIVHVKRWVEVAARLDAPVLRVFTGRSDEEGGDKKAIMEQVAQCIKECALYGRQHGVMIGLQNHNELLKTAAEVEEMLQLIASDWVCLNLDIGSLRTADPYEEIARLAPKACTWQIKENVYRKGKEEPTDLKKIVQILHETGYQGYLPLETLGPGNAREKMTVFMEKMSVALEA